MGGGTSKICLGGKVVVTNKNKQYSVMHKEWNYGGCCSDSWVYAVYLKEIMVGKVNNEKIRHYFKLQGRKYVYSYTTDSFMKKVRDRYSRKEKYDMVESYTVARRVMGEHIGEEIVINGVIRAQTTEHTPILNPSLNYSDESREGEPSAPHLEDVDLSST